MLRRTVLYIFCLLIFVFKIDFVLGQSNESDSLDAIRSQFVHSYKRLLSVRAFILGENPGFSIMKTDTKGGLLSYKTNDIASFGFSAYYKQFGLGIGFKLPVNQDQIAEKGKTETFKLRLDIFGKKSLKEVFLQINNGFYLYNTSDFFSQINL